MGLGHMFSPHSGGGVRAFLDHNHCHAGAAAALGWGALLSFPESPGPPPRAELDEGLLTLELCALSAARKAPPAQPPGGGQWVSVTQIPDGASSPSVEFILN